MLSLFRLSIPPLAGLALLACASSADPPGGPEDSAAPLIASVEPESGAVLTTPPREITVTFDEVISERVAGTPPDLQAAVILSPVNGATRVRWRRQRLSAQPREGFRAGVIYRLEVLPTVTDLRQNRMRAGRTFVFSTGPAIPGARLSGAVVDWVGGRPVPRALVEAVLMPDSLPYRTQADSTGYFDLRQIPAGTYLVYGAVDANNDRRVGAREAFDSVRITVDSNSRAELYAFPHDTLAPRLRQVEIVDSLTLRLTFDRPLEPAAPLDTSAVHLAPAEDSTSLIGVEGVYTRAEFDSLRARLERERRVADTAAPAAPPSRPAAPLPGAVAQAPARAPLDSTVAQRMIARRPSPSDIRLVRLLQPLTPDVRYYLFVADARSLTGRVGSTRGQVRRPRGRAAASP